MLAHSDNFPAPVHEGSASIWHLAEVFAWLEAKGGYALERDIYALERDILEVAKVALQVNLTKETHWLSVKTSWELEALVS